MSGGITCRTRYHTTFIRGRYGLSRYAYSSNAPYSAANKIPADPSGNVLNSNAADWWCYHLCIATEGCYQFQKKNNSYMPMQFRRDAALQNKIVQEEIFYYH